MDGGLLLDLSILDQPHEWGRADLKHQMIELFLETERKHVERVREGLENGDLELTKRSAHSLKSSALKVGPYRGAAQGVAREERRGVFCPGWRRVSGK